MAKSNEEVDFDFFDSPRTTGKNDRTVTENATRPRKGETSAKDDFSQSTVSSANRVARCPVLNRTVRYLGNLSGKKSDSKPDMYVSGISAEIVKNRDESSDSDGRDSPRSNASASTTQSRRTIEAKIPSAGVQHDSDDDYDDKNDNSDDDRSGSRSNDRRSYSSSNDERSSNGNARNIKDTKHSRKKSNSISSSVSSKDEPKARKRDSEREKAKKKSAYLSDDSDGNDVDITDTDSDVTEVSPLGSPHKPPDFPRPKSTKPRPVRNTSATINRSGSTNINHILSNHRDTMDLKVLLQTVLDMENEGSAARSRRVASGTGAQSGDFCRQRKNYSFTNEQVMRIDRENQRLMENIMRKAREARKVKQELKAKKRTGMTPSRPASSAINRFRQQQKIEVENLGILRRLQQTRPTKELQRDVQIGEYKRQLVFAGSAPPSSIQPRIKSSFSRYAESSTTEPPPIFHDNTDLITGRPRPQSALVTRPQSGKRASGSAKGSRARSASLKKESTKDGYGSDFEVDELH